MIDWHTSIINDLLPSLEGDDYWKQIVHDILFKPQESAGLHLAIFVEPYLQYILEKRKTVESRFGTRRFAPFGKLEVGDVILLKRSSGPVLGLCRASAVWYYNLEPSSWKFLRDKFSAALCAHDPDFWRQRREASFATIVQLDSVRSIQPFRIPKTDRRGWVVLHSSTSQ